MIFWYFLQRNKKVLSIVLTFPAFIVELRRDKVASLKTKCELMKRNKIYNNNYYIYYNKYIQFIQNGIVRNRYKYKPSK